MPRKKKHRKCCWCDRVLNNTSGSGLQQTKDHIVARSNGGKSTVICCRACNELKANLHLKSWIWIITHVPQWWKLHKEQSLRGVSLYKNLKATVKRDDQ